MDDLSNIPFDGSSIGDDGVSLSDLPPFLLNKLMSRSRSNSLAATRAQTGGSGADLGADPVTSCSIASASSAAVPSGNLSAGVDLSIALQRARGYSFEFLSLGFNAEEPLPLEQSSGASLDAEATPLIKNGTHQRPRGDSINFDIGDKPNQRPRGDSIIFDPCSFSDGGIHEQRALLIKGRRTSLGSISEFDGLLSSSAGDR